MTPSLKKIVNHQEEVAYRELQKLAEDYGYSVHIKIRLADVIPIEASGISDALYSFALKSHFDFIVCSENRDPLFAVEFDGPSHQDAQQRERDKKKNEICERFGLPLLRINTRHLIEKYNKASLLRWIISAWELQKAFDEAQAKGQIPADEDFDPIFLWHTGETIEEVHPHWVSLKPRRHLQELQKKGRIPVSHTCGFALTDDDGNYRGIEWIDVNDGKVVVVESGMRAQLFPLHLGQLFSELMTVLLYDKLMVFLASGNGSTNPSDVSDRLQELKHRYRFAGSHSGPTKVNFSLSLASGRFV